MTLVKINSCKGFIASLSEGNKIIATFKKLLSSLSGKSILTFYKFLTDWTDLLDDKAKHSWSKNINIMLPMLFQA